MDKILKIFSLFGLILFFAQCGLLFDGGSLVEENGSGSRACVESGDCNANGVDETAININEEFDNDGSEESDSENSDGSADVVEADVDTDEDGYLDSVDNCPDVYNPSQKDFNDDGTGDDCDYVTDKDFDGLALAIDPNDNTETAFSIKDGSLEDDEVIAFNSSYTQTFVAGRKTLTLWKASSESREALDRYSIIVAGVTDPSKSNYTVSQACTDDDSSEFGICIFTKSLIGNNYMEEAIRPLEEKPATATKYDRIDLSNTLSRATL